MSDDQMHDCNRQIIAEFQENEGRIGGPFEGASVLLLHHVGAKTGTERFKLLTTNEIGEVTRAADPISRPEPSVGGDPTNWAE